MPRIMVRNQAGMRRNEKPYIPIHNGMNRLHSSRDDGIVVVRVRKDAGSMAATVRALREKLGDEAMGGLQNFVDDTGRRWKDDVLALAGERFDRRLSEEVGALRLDMSKDFAAMRVECAKEFAAVRGEMAETRFAMVKWAFVFWVGQLVAMTGIMALLLRTIMPR